MNIKDLKPGEVFLYYEDLGQCYKFQNLLIACKRAIDAGRSPQNGWNIVDDLGITYEEEDWNLLATL